MFRAFLLCFGIVFSACSLVTSTQASEDEVVIDGPVEIATLAGGCFWCMEPPFEKLPGVYSVVSGYSGGPEINPTYQQVASGGTGHTEAVQVSFNPEKIRKAVLSPVLFL